MTAEQIARALGKGREKQNGPRWMTFCPAHDDRNTPNLSVMDGDSGKPVFHCFAGCSQSALIAALKSRGLWNGTGSHPRLTQGPKPKTGKAEWKPVLPVPTNATEPPKAHPKHGCYSARYEYRDQDGRLLSYVCRFDKPDGSKEFSPLVYCECRGAFQWRWLGSPKPRALFGLELLAANPAAPVLVCEGEKATLAGRKLCPDHVCLTWPGGAGNAHCSDWKPVAGRAVVIWPDQDEPGYKAARQVARQCFKAGALSVRMICPPEDTPKGFDAADATQEQARAMLATAADFQDNLEAETESRTDEETEDRRLDDIGNGHRFAAQHRGRALYVAKFKGWLYWDGRRWARDDGNLRVEKLAEETARSIYTEAADWAAKAAAAPDDAQKHKYSELSEKTLAWAKKSADSKQLAAMLKRAANKKGMNCTPADLDSLPFLFNVQNGTLDLKTGQLQGHRPGDLLTQLAPVVFDLSARCPTWLAFLERIMDGNRGLIEFLQRAAGYTLTGDTTEQCLFILHGGGANGKSTYLEAVKHTFGEYAVQADPQSFMALDRDSRGPRSDLVAMRAARFVSAIEVNSGRRLDEALIKSLTGGEALSCSDKFEKQFSYYPQFAVWLATNHRPGIRGQDGGIWRRIKLVPFTVSIPEHEWDKGLWDKLKLEASGILNWLLAGCLAWQQDGLGCPPEVLAATKDYREESDWLAGFISECCVVKPSCRATAAELFKAYKDWCDAGNERAISQPIFGRALQERGFQKCRIGHSSKAGWLGIGLKVEPMREDAVPFSVTFSTEAVSKETTGKPSRTVPQDSLEAGKNGSTDGRIEPDQDAEDDREFERNQKTLGLAQ